MGQIGNVDQSEFEITQPTSDCPDCGQHELSEVVQKQLEIVNGLKDMVLRGGVTGVLVAYGVAGEDGDAHHGVTFRFDKNRWALMGFVQAALTDIMTQNIAEEEEEDE